MTDRLPRFNWGAFLMPPVWGVAHGQWAGVFFLPAWAFVDNMLRGTTEFGVWTKVLGAAMAAATLALQVLFAANANTVVGHRANDDFEPVAYLRRQRFWAVAGGVMAFGMALWIYAYISRNGSVLPAK